MSYINRAIEPLLIKKYQSYKSVAVTGVDVIDNSHPINELNDKINSLYSSFYDIDSGDESCRFNIELAKEHKN